MTDTVEVTALVLKSTPVGEYDRRVVLLTREQGRIACFARGARRPGSPVMAASLPFCFGTYRLRSGRPHEQTAMRGGHLDYMLYTDEAGRRVETFPLYRKACMGMTDDGRFCFFHFIKIK